MIHTNEKTKSRTLYFSLILVSLAAIAAREYFKGSNADLSLAFAFLATITVVGNTVLIFRDWVDIFSFISFVQETDPTESILPSPEKYIALMPWMQAAGMVATISIAFNFIVGMLAYLVMHLVNIYSFSFICHLNWADMASDKSLQFWAGCVFVFGFIVAAADYIFFVYNGEKFSLTVIPYIIALTSMTITMYIGYAYSQRPFLFRFLPAFGSTCFFISDSLIGHAEFQHKHPADILIDPLYVIAINCMTAAVLFMPSNDETRRSHGALLPYTSSSSTNAVSYA